MPLVSGESAKTESGFKYNFKKELEAGKPEKQALAIAYSKARGDANDSSSAKQYDVNHFFEIKHNPISKVGVFQYSGQQIDPSGSWGLDPLKAYNVFRSEDALNNPETIESFRLLPFTDEHMMLGHEEDGLTPAERKGVHGVTGQDVEFDFPYLTANIKVFSSKLSQLIEDGKKELSIGYRCIYEKQNGEYDGHQYEFLQTNIMGNHLALVQEGRSGHDVSVLDHQFTFSLDTKDITMGDMSKEDKDYEKPADAKDEGEMSIAECREMMKKIASRLDALSETKDEFEDDLEAEEINEMSNTTEDEVEPEDFVKRAEGIDDEEGKKETEKKAEEEGDAKDEELELKKEGAMDTKLLTKQIMSQIAARDDLAKRLSKHIGTFDHAKKTLDEVASYGLKKLGISFEKGSERHVLSGYLAAAKVSPVAIAQDHKVASSCVDAYLRGDK